MSRGKTDKACGFRKIGVSGSFFGCGNRTLATFLSDVAGDDLADDARADRSGTKLPACGKARLGGCSAGGCLKRTLSPNSRDPALLSHDLISKVELGYFRYVFAHDGFPCSRIVVYVGFPARSKIKNSIFDLSSLKARTSSSLKPNPAAARLDCSYLLTTIRRRQQGHLGEAARL